VPTTYDTISAADLGKLGFRLIIFANQGLRVSIKAIEQAYTRLRVAGRACVLKDDMVSLQAVFDLVGVKELEESERRYLLPTEVHRDAPPQDAKVFTHAR
jgi:phosphoenolpyruvate phosphomutase